MCLRNGTKTLLHSDKLQRKREKEKEKKEWHFFGLLLNYLNYHKIL